MAKKSRRSYSKKTTSTTPPGASSPEALSSPPAAQGEGPSPTPKAAGSQVDFSVQYHYVLNDLRQMAILAVVMFGVLIALSLVIH